MRIRVRGWRTPGEGARHVVKVEWVLGCSSDRCPVPTAPSRLPPSHTWKQRLFPSRRLALILLGLSAILSTMLIVFGVQGDDFSIQLWRMREMLEGMNGTAAVEMAALSKKTELEAKVTEVETTVTALAAEMDAAKKRLLAQVAVMRNSLRAISCDLEKFKANKTGGQATCCPPGWAAFRGHCYWESRQGQPWQDAKNDCEDKDSHLAIINSHEEQLFLAVRVRPHFMWIGLTDASGSWKWVDGTPYTVRSEDWMPEQPDNWDGHDLGGGEDCAHFHYDGRWNDDHCSRHYGWICEMEAAN